MSEHAFGSRRVTTTSDSRRAMREQQAQKVAKNTSVHGGLQSLLRHAEF